MAFDLDFFADKNILITGHTGFKGSWLAYILQQAGANVVGYALEPPTDPNLFDLLELSKNIESVEGDIRNFDTLNKTFVEHKPEIVIHLAAQPLVLAGYQYPIETYETNVMGTVNVLEATRNADCVRSLLNVTTDKVYFNEGDMRRAFSEDDKLDGFDPYSNSKSCSELVTHSYTKSFLSSIGCVTSTARAGNVIGGGDFAADRIIPDCVRALESGSVLEIRKPHSVRPYQHVLEPLFAYLKIVSSQYHNPAVAGAYNIGPSSKDCIETEQLVKLFSTCLDNHLQWKVRSEESVLHEADFLKLDSTKMNRVFDWSPKWRIEEAVKYTADWTKAYLEGADFKEIMDEQINDYLGA